jgi:hypothetical protein
MNVRPSESCYILVVIACFGSFDTFQIPSPESNVASDVTELGIVPSQNPEIHEM